MGFLVEYYKMPPSMILELPYSDIEFALEHRKIVPTESEKDDIRFATMYAYQSKQKKPNLKQFLKILDWTRPLMAKMFPDNFRQPGESPRDYAIRRKKQREAKKESL